MFYLFSLKNSAEYLFVNLSPKIRKRLNALLQLFIAIAAIVFLLYRIPAIFDKDFFFKTVFSVISGKYFPLLIIAVVLLMPVNWLLEAIKWKFTISKAEKINLITAIRAILGGITVSMITPNRTGEYLGRVFILKSPVNGILLTLAGSFGQLITTFVMGCTSLFIAMPVLINYLAIKSDGSLTLLRIAVITMIGGAIMIYLKFPVFYKIADISLLRKYEKIKKLARLSEVFSQFDLIMILLISLLRYVIFSTQYYLLLVIGGIQISPQSAFIVISLQYFIMAFIPSVALSEIGIRGSVAIMIFSIYFQYGKGVLLNDEQAFSVASASISLWFINLAVPAIAGIPAVFKTRFIKQGE